MILEKRTCHRCQSANIVKNGKNTSGTQTFKCKDCGCCRVLDTRQKGRQPDAEEVRRAYVERQSLRGTARIFGVSHPVILGLLKKSAVASPV